MSEFAQALPPILPWLDGRLVWIGLAMALPTALLTLRGRRLGILFPIAVELCAGCWLLAAPAEGQASANRCRLLGLGLFGLYLLCVCGRMGAERLKQRRGPEK